MSDLLTTKIHRPISSPKRVERSRLTLRINDGLNVGRQVVLVSAPAGFGKTTCILEWLQTLPDRPVSWFSIDTEDDDPLRFYSYLMAALQKVKPELGCEIEAMLRSGQSPTSDGFSTALINEIQELNQDLILVLDDFHDIQDPAILQMIEKLVNNMPACLTLVLISREDPALSLARLRANSQLTEIRAEDLRFSIDETRSFLNELMKLNLTPHDLDLLEDRTEGWVVGLQLAALSMRDRDNPSAFIASLSGSQRYILNYLTEEVLDRQPDEVQQFLLQISILERFNGEVCDAVTGRSDGRALLERLYQDNLFIIPLDDSLSWYRYHHLFADLLRDRFTALYKGRKAEYHVRASQWFLRAGLPLDAIQQALTGQDYDLALQQLESHSLELLIQGHSKTIETFLRAIPAEWSSHGYRTNLAFAWMYLLRGDFQKAFPYYERLKISLSDFDDDRQPLSNSIQAEWLALQAMLTAGQGSPQAGLELANQALKIVPENDGYVRSLIYMSLVGAYQQMDDYQSAFDAYQQLIHHARLVDNFNSEILGYAGLGQLTLTHGHYQAGFEAASQGVNRLEESGLLPPISAALYGSLGEVYYQWNQYDKALVNYQRAAQLSNLCGLSDGETCLYAIRSRQAQLAGDLTTAEQEIQKGIDLMQRSAPIWAREVVLAQQVRVLLASNRLAEAETAFRNFGFSTGEKYSLPKFSPGQKITSPEAYFHASALRILLYRANNRNETASLPAGIALADKLIAAALQGKFILSAIEILLLRAEMNAALGNVEASLEDTARALQLGEPERLIRVFLEGGQLVIWAVADLVERGLLKTVSQDYARKILSAFNTTSTGIEQIKPAGREPLGISEERVPLIAALTERECEVLRLMAKGLKYEEIADSLVISLNTVRSHVKAIYGKLNTNNRTHAIETARKQMIL